MEKGREGLLSVLKKRLCEVEAQLATARTTYKSILGLETLSFDDFFFFFFFFCITLVEMYCASIHSFIVFVYNLYM